MLLNGKNTRYDKKMLESRNIISKSGFFDPLIYAVSNLILRKAIKNNFRDNYILDAGCGEGSHLSRILTKLEFD